jgi:hypothetical protein
VTPLFLRHAAGVAWIDPDKVIGVTEDYEGRVDVLLEGGYVVDHVADRLPKILDRLGWTTT